MSYQGCCRILNSRLMFSLCDELVGSDLDGVMRASTLVGYSRLVEFAGSELAENIKRAQRVVDAERSILDIEFDHPPTQNDLFKLNADGLPYEASDENDEYEFDSEGDTNVEAAGNQSGAESSASVSEVYGELGGPSRTSFFKVEVRSKRSHDVDVWSSTMLASSPLCSYMPPDEKLESSEDELLSYSRRKQTATEASLSPNADAPKQMVGSSPAAAEGPTPVFIDLDPITFPRSPPRSESEMPVMEELVVTVIPSIFQQINKFIIV